MIRTIINKTFHFEKDYLMKGDIYTLERSLNEINTQMFKNLEFGNFFEIHRREIQDLFNISDTMYSDRIFKNNWTSVEKKLFVMNYISKQRNEV